MFLATDMSQSADCVLKAQAAASMQSTQQKQSLQHEELQAKTFHNSSDKVNIKAQVLSTAPHTACFQAR